MTTTVFLTTIGTNTWSVPSDWRNSNNIIEVIGAGGGGSGKTNHFGGGGGGYAKIVNLTISGSITYAVGAGGAAGISGSSDGSAGGDTWFNGANLAGASIGCVSGAGGGTSAAGSTGTGSGATTYTGGNGANGGAGGAAGPNGNGANASSNTGGQGDNGHGGTTSLNSPYGSAGGHGTEYGSSPAYGSGGGGSAGNDGFQNVGGNYGGGGASGLASTGAVGAQGLIILTYSSLTYTLTCAQGSFTLTGENMTPYRKAYISLSYGSYILTGESISFKYDNRYIFGCQTGYFTLTGENCTLTKGISNKIMAGIFSLVVSPSLLGESASGLVMEAQNSYGLVPAADALSNGILIDNGQSSNGQDSYYSAWSNGVTSGGINYNDTTLWQNWEPTIETDIIPIGTILNKGTLGNIEFKLDRPMVSGDAIRMWWRPSLSDNYTLMGTTTTAQLSDYYPTRISQSQWAQFMIQFKCASTGSSFICLREVRIHLT